MASNTTPNPSAYGPESPWWDHPGFSLTPTSRADTYPFIDPSQHNLAGRAVLITGASRGIGRSIALSYAAAGASYIALAARTVSALATVADEVAAAAKKAGRPAPLAILPLGLDVTDAGALPAVVKAVKDAFGRLDILVNNAGIRDEFALIGESDPDDWWRPFDVNLRAPYLVARAFLPLLLESPPLASPPAAGVSAEPLKTIVNIASVVGIVVSLLPGSPGPTAYQITKFALLRLTEYFDSHHGGKGLLTYAVHPGAIDTDMMNGVEQDPNFPPLDKEELPGHSVVWLSAERRKWLAARYISVNWDLQELEKDKDRIVKGDLLKFKFAA